MFHLEQKQLHRNNKYIYNGLKTMQLTVNERIKIVKNSLKKSSESFVELIDIPLGTFNGVIGTKQRSPSHSLLAAIVKALPNLNPVWLLTGEGEMWFNEKVGESVRNEKREIEILTGRLAEIEDKNEKLNQAIKTTLDAQSKKITAMEKQVKEVLDSLKNR